ncbi:DUF177 domain-containing protein [Dehalococcoidia bacterium]|nr:DUF177 domain-containing protein [Dehalococcoidia bacterium]
MARLLMEPSGSVREFHLDERIGLAEDVEAQEVVGRVKLLRTNKSIWISADLTSTVGSECGRCLTEFRQPIRMNLEEEALPILNPDTGVKIGPFEFVSEYLYIDEKHNLDMSATLQEYASMGVPMNPLCKPDCVGLCQKCGGNLNESFCECDNVSRDCRWDALFEAATTVTER